MISIGLKAYVGAAIGVALIASVALSYNHYSKLLSANKAYAVQVEGLETRLSIESAKVAAYAEAVDRWDKASQAQSKALTELSAARHEARAYSKEIKNVLSKHDLAELAARKPALVEQRVNAGTDRVFRLLEQTTDTTSPAGN